MKIYVASKWEEHETVRNIMTELESLGHTITCDWTNHEYPKNNVNQQLMEYAIMDIDGVRDADMVIVYAVNPTYTYRGAIGEMTAAIALDKRVCLIGHGIDECIFVNHPLVRRFNSMTEIIKYLERKQ